MIKKGLFAVVLLAMVAFTVQAGDLAPTNGKLKVDSSTIDTTDTNDVQYMSSWPSTEKIWWPYTICYEELEICQIPIKMEIGMYAELENCAPGIFQKKIVLKQVACTTITKSNGFAGTSADFPCYKGCTDIRLRANFNMKLGTVLYKQQVNGQYIVNNWRAYYTTKYRTPGDVIPGLMDWQSTELCVDAWQASLYYATVGTEVQVGEVAVTVKPST